MRKTPFLIMLVCGTSLFVCASCCRQAAQSATNSVPGIDTAELRDAVGIAVDAVNEQSRYPADHYTLVSAQRMMIKGKYVWRVTFKPARLLPKDPSREMIGAGGEIFVNVDLKTRKPELRYGE